MNPEKSVLTPLFWKIALVAAAGAFLALSTAGGSVNSTKLAVMTYNIGGLGSRQPATKDVIQALKSRDIPDIILLQEVQGEKQALRIAQGVDFPNVIYANHKGKQYGLAIISSLPISNSQSVYFKSSENGYGAVAAEVEANDQKLVVCSLHLDRIDPIKVSGQRVDMSWGDALGYLKTEILEDTIRSRSVEELVRWLGTLKADRILIGGDFNTVPFSKAIRRMNRDFDDALWPSTAYFKGSYRNLPFFISPRIDFLFHSPSLKSSSATIVRTGTGDHYPVMALVEFKKR